MNSICNLFLFWQSMFDFFVVFVYFSWEFVVCLFQCWEFSPSSAISSSSHPGEMTKVKKFSISEKEMISTPAVKKFSDCNLAAALCHPFPFWPADKALWQGVEERVRQERWKMTQVQEDQGTRTKDQGEPQRPRRGVIDRGGRMSTKMASQVSC